MIDLPTWFGGAVTIALLIVLGIFVYPWLLKRRGGAVVVAAITALLALLYFAFDRASGISTTASALLALTWAVAPVVAGAIVYRAQRGSSATESAPR